jgi:hypothetical protein
MVAHGSMKVQASQPRSSSAQRLAPGGHWVAGSWAAQLGHPPQAANPLVLDGPTVMSTLEVEGSALVHVPSPLQVSALHRS